MLCTKALPIPGNGKNLFNDDRPGYDIGEHRPKICNNWDKGVFQCVAENNLLAGNALCLCRSDVVLTQHISIEERVRRVIYAMGERESVIIGRIRPAAVEPFAGAD